MTNSNNSSVPVIVHLISNRKKAFLSITVRGNKFLDTFAFVI